tara:strand:- start:638 stop:1156 length:519 start_codon:yes stop_codon:yes gene_type:complete
MIPNAIYTVDFNKFVKQLLITFLRKAKTLALVRAVIKPLITGYTVFETFKTRQIYITGHNAQITLFQQALNDGFDATQRRIYIANAVIEDTEHYYDPEYGEPLFFYDDGDGDPQYFLDRSTFNQTGGNFSVNVPVAMEEADPTDKLLFETALKAEIERYKIFGTTYTIKYYA